MEANKEPNQSPIFDQLRQYAETRIKLAKYQAIETGTSIVANIIADVVMLCSILLAVLFISFTLAFLIAALLHSYWEGFGCVTLLYVIVALVLIYNRKVLEKPVMNALIKKLIK
jgi:hypothetical protein